MKNQHVKIFDKFKPRVVETFNSIDEKLNKKNKKK